MIRSVMNFLMIGALDKNWTNMNLQLYHFQIPRKHSDCVTYRYMY